ncbi:hypothetical protein IQ06DRAFT_66433 [Phaeosphaeriaceae sp. SRC1lsM3a]|nr:hypothetical protein IQ06DRAFT_66433 [Stagonospora sp. SRC1lsM3a]
MSSNRESAPANHMTAGAFTEIAPHTSTYTSPLPDNAIVQEPPFHHCAQFGTDPLSHLNLFDDFIWNDDSFDDQNFEQLLALPDETISLLPLAVSQNQGSVRDIPQNYEAFDFLTAGNMGNILGTNTADIYAEYGVGDAYLDQLDIDYGNKYCDADDLSSTVEPSRSQQGLEPGWQMEPSDEYSVISTHLESNGVPGISPNTPKRPALVASTSFTEHSTTSSTSSGSSYVQSTPESVNPSSSSELKLRRGRPPTYPSLSKYEL